MSLRAARAIPLLVLAFSLGGCLSPRTDDRAATEHARYRPLAFRPEDFPDIPLFPLTGYELMPDADQLALSLAGGTVRRFEVSMIRRSGERDDPPSAVLDRYGIELHGLGWRQEGEDRWRKDHERLIIEAGRSGRLTTVRFHLRPIAEDASSMR